MAKGKSNEGHIQSVICEYLEAKRHCFFRLNNIPAFNKGESGRITMRKLPKYTPKGLPDIIVIKNGYFIALEVKDKSPQSKDQKIFEARVKDALGRYHIVRSIDDVQNVGL